MKSLIFIFIVIAHSGFGCEQVGHVCNNALRPCCPDFICTAVQSYEDVRVQVELNRAQYQQIGAVERINGTTGGSEEWQLAKDWGVCKPNPVETFVLFGNLIRHDSYQIYHDELDNLDPTIVADEVCKWVKECYESPKKFGHGFVKDCRYKGIISEVGYGDEAEYTAAIAKIELDVFTRKIQMNTAGCPSYLDLSRMMSLLDVESSYEFSLHEITFDRYSGKPSSTNWDKYIRGYILGSGRDGIKFKTQYGIQSSDEFKDMKAKVEKRIKEKLADDETWDVELIRLFAGYWNNCQFDAHIRGVLPGDGKTCPLHDEQYAFLEELEAYPYAEIDFSTMEIIDHYPPRMTIESHFEPIHSDL